ncbi:MAG: PepSY domain-containing protein [Reyranella sp.]|uniref:PepSY domain-containing protein n=1 Tax=Reyranella sp. TaxID=1929291 RepID=UPI001ACB52F7|nr:PepSY domain-containing protein [Reyranella sp.]MBN9087068.1 PepSY domain-containing protein [Reyranella sp.]
MTRLVFAAALVLMSASAFAQTRGQAAAAGAAGVTARLQSQGYRDIHDLRRTPDGKWTGKAIRNGAPVTVTSDPAGTTIAR